jgi:hypothetical protein
MIVAFSDKDGASVMDGMQRTTSRDAGGRFGPGCSGNPAGKRPGTRNRANVLAELLREGEAEAIGRQMIDKAVAGDAAAVRFCAERLIPRPRGRAIQLDVPEGESPAGEVVATFNAALRAMAAGEITPGEALTVARVLEGRYRVLRAWQLEQKLTRWNDPLPIPGDDGPSPLPEVALRAQEASFGRRPVTAARREGAAVTASTTTPRHEDEAVTASTMAPPPERERRQPSKGARSSSGAPIDRANSSALSPPLRNPPEGRSKGLQAGEEMARGGGEEKAGESESGSEFVIDDDLAIAIRDQILVIPGVREAARNLGLLGGKSLHSACISEAAVAPAPARDGPIRAVVRTVRVERAVADPSPG